MTAAAVRVRRRALATAWPAVALLAVALLTTGCGGDGPGSAAPASSAPAVRDAATPAPGGAATSGTFSSTDIGWLQLMIAMDDQALLLLESVPDRTSDPRIEGWAAPVAADYRTEVAGLRKLLTRAGVPDTNPHKGHDMPGMVTEDELRTLRDARGSAFDRLFLAAMREHLDQAANISHSQRASGADPAAKKTAAKVEKSALAQRTRLPGPDQAP